MCLLCEEDLAFLTLTPVSLMTFNVSQELCSCRNSSRLHFKGSNGVWAGDDGGLFGDFDWALVTALTGFGRGSLSMTSRTLYETPSTCPRRTEA